MDRKPFYCREWAFQKLSHCLDQRPASKTCGALLLGGSGCGKTTFCTEICNPSVARQQRALNRRLLCHHFLEAHNEKSLSLSEFLRSLVTQILNHTTESHREKSKLLKNDDDESETEVGRNPRTQIADSYLEKLKSDGEIQMALRAKNIEQNPDDCLKRALLFPLLEIEPPKSALFILIDSIDEFSFNYSNSTLTRCKQQQQDKGLQQQQQSKTIAELLANHHHLFPQWLLLVCTARKQSKSIAKMFTGFRKLSLDDLRKSQVVRDVQQYILARLDREQNLRQHISRDTAEMLNQLHIKSNGCFLYLEKVLDGVSDNFIALREVREIPGTLNGLYLWLCQRLFNRRQFAKVRPLLNVILASRTRLDEPTLYDVVRVRDPRLTREAFRKRLHLLRRVLRHHGADNTVVTLFHHSFAEWLLDVKHCTQKYLCDIFDGHAILALYYTLHAKFLNNREIYDYAFHLTRVAQFLSESREKFEKQSQQQQKIAAKATTTATPKEGEVMQQQPIYAEVNKKKVVADSEVSVKGSDIQQQQDDQQWLDVNTTIKLWLILSGCNVEECLLEGNEMAGVNFGAFLPTDQKVSKLLLECGAVEQSDVGEEDLEEEEIVDGVGLEYHSQISLASTSSEISPEPFYNGQEGRGQQALHVAARLGQVDVVKMLVDAGANIDEPDLDGWTPLRAAAWGGHTEVVELLMSRGCALDSVDAENRTALRAASWSGHDDVVAALLRRGARVDAVDHEGRTALIAAAYMGHVDIVERLLDAGADVDHADADGRTALSVAALCAPRPLDGGGGGSGVMGGQNGVVATLLDRGAKVDHVDKEGMTPLLVASFEGHRDVCEILLENEADVDHTDHSGRSPLWAAASMGHAPVVALLLFWGCCIDSMDSEGRTVLSVAAAQGCVEVVRQLLDRGLDEQHRDNSGWTPLHYAAFEGHRDVCETLLEAGARVDETDNEGKAALVLAAQGGHASLVELLVGGGGSGVDGGAGGGNGEAEGTSGKYAAPVDQRPHDGKTALRLAALEGHYDVVEILLENGAQIDAKDADGRSTLYVLALDDRLAMAKFFLRRGADVETRDLEGRTPLHVSAWQGHTDMVQLLLRYGRAHVDACDHENRTALHSACWQGHGAIARLLLEHAAAPDHTCNQGATALGIAAQEGHEACVVALLEHGADPEHSDACGRNALRVASKSGHRDVVKLLEDYAAAAAGAGVATKASSSATSLASASTAETKPSSAVLYPPTAIAGGIGFSAATPTNNGTEWTEQQRRSMISLGNHSSNSKSSSNLTNSSHSSRKGLGATGAEMFNSSSNALTRKENNVQPLTFTQQLQQCTRGASKTPPTTSSSTRSSSRKHHALSPLRSQPQSPIYASPPLSPTSSTTTTPTITGSGALNIYQPGVLSSERGAGSRRAPPPLHPFLWRHHNDEVVDDDEEDEWIGVGSGGGTPAPAPDTHFARDTHMRIILGQDHGMVGGAGGGVGNKKGGFFGSGGDNKEKENGTAAAKSTKSQKSKRNGIVTNPAMRLVANVKNGLDNAAANLRKSASGAAHGHSQKYENPAQKTNSFHWRKETPL